MPKVSEIMSREVASLESKDTAASAAKKMVEGGFGCLLVTRKGSVVGIVTTTDIARYLARSKNYLDPLINALARQEPEEGPYR